MKQTCVDNQGSVVEAIGAGDRRFDSERLYRDDLVFIDRCAWLNALRAVDEDGVVLRPEDFNDLLHLLLLAKPVPPDALEEALRRGQWRPFNRDDRIALGNKKVIPTLYEVA